MRYCVFFLILFVLHLPNLAFAQMPFWTENNFQEQYLSDTSVTRFVSRDVPLSDPEYIPTGLFPIASEYIDERGRRSMLRSDANDALQLLSRDFTTQFGKPLVVVSAYRDYAYQKRLWDLGRCTETLCAPPGNSEHQLGLAIDIFEASTEDNFFASTDYQTYYAWLEENAHAYGWTQSYIHGSEIDGYEVEPWHWRYVGIELATRLREYDWNLTQYVQFMRFLAEIRSISFFATSFSFGT